MFTNKEHFILKLQGYIYGGELAEYIYYAKTGDYHGEIIGNDNNGDRVVHRVVLRKEFMTKVILSKNAIFMADKIYYTLGDPLVWI